MTVDMDRDSKGSAVVTAESTNLITLKTNTVPLLLKCCKENQLSTGKGVAIRKVFEFDNLLSLDRLHFEVADDYSTANMV